jgi:hypothetical protein
VRVVEQGEQKKGKIVSGWHLPLWMQELNLVKENLKVSIKYRPQNFPLPGARKLVFKY